MPSDFPKSRDLTRTRQDILRVAIQHFSRVGFFGARVDQIAAETATTKRMIYYCFGGKDELFAAALTHVYEGIRDFEESLNLDGLPPRDAVVRYTAETIRYHEAHPELALLVRNENQLGGVHLSREGAEPLRRRIVRILDGVLQRGRAAGDFREGPTGIELHVAVTALANFRITNEATISALFGYSMREPERLTHDIDQYVAMLLGWLDATPGDRGNEAPLHLVGEPAEQDLHHNRKASS